MELDSNLVIVAAILLITFFLIGFSQNKVNKSKGLNTSKMPASAVLKIRAKEAFKNLVIIEKNGTVMICETGIMNRPPKELVFVNINPLGQKRKEQKLNFIEMTYREIPSVSELKADLKQELKKYA